MSHEPSEPSKNRRLAVNEHTNVMPEVTPTGHNLEFGQLDTDQIWPLNFLVNMSDPDNDGEAVRNGSEQNGGLPRFPLQLH